HAALSAARAMCRRLKAQARRRRSLEPKATKRWPVVDGLPSQTMTALGDCAHDATATAQNPAIEPRSQPPARHAPRRRSIHGRPQTEAFKARMEAKATDGSVCLSWMVCLRRP